MLAFPSASAAEVLLLLLLYSGIQEAKSTFMNNLNVPLPPNNEQHLHLRQQHDAV